MHEIMPGVGERQRAIGTVLVVEDETDIADILRLALTDEGYTVRICYSGSHAVIDAQSSLPDLILLDVLLPGLDGWGVCSALQEEPETATIPVMFLTALAGVEDKCRGLLGYRNTVDYLSKPFDLPELLARVAVHLRHARAPHVQPDDADAEDARLPLPFADDPLDGAPEEDLDDDDKDLGGAEDLGSSDNSVQGARIG